jgi:hypothetical protein
MALHNLSVTCGGTKRTLACISVIFKAAIDDSSKLETTSNDPRLQDKHEDVDKNTSPEA